MGDRSPGSELRIGRHLRHRLRARDPAGTRDDLRRRRDVLVRTGTGHQRHRHLRRQSGLVLSAPQTAAQWFGPIEENSATWNPSVVVAFPPGVIAGDYQGTVTFSVA